jgi:hypothetical protein
MFDLPRFAELLEQDLGAYESGIFETEPRRVKICLVIRTLIFFQSRIVRINFICFIQKRTDSRVHQNCHGWQRLQRSVSLSLPVSAHGSKVTWP